MRFLQPSHERRDIKVSDEASRSAGLSARVSDALRHLSGLARTLLLIGGLGAVWLAWDVASDGEILAGDDRFDQIDAYIAEQMDDSRIPGGSIAVIEDGALVHARGFGDDGHGDQITADTPFWIGSNTKSITALAVMQLAAAGALELDAPVRDYLPGFAVADEAASARITVRQLLNQTSGISRHDGLRAVVDADPDRSIQDVVAGMADLELNRPVGERFEYANLNSVVLGAVIEAVTGQTWQDYVQVNVFDPLAMTNTYTDKVAAEAAGLSATHRYAFGFPFETDGEHFPGLAPTGYVYPSAADSTGSESSATQASPRCSRRPPTSAPSRSRARISPPVTGPAGSSGRSAPHPTPAGTRGRCRSSRPGWCSFPTPTRPSS